LYIAEHGLWNIAKDTLGNTNLELTILQENVPLQLLA